MESISLSNAIFTISNKSILQKKTNHSQSKRGSLFSVQDGQHRSRFAIIKNYKQYDFQDFHGYAKPSHLSEATELKVCTENSQGNYFNSISLGRSRSLFKVKLLTSNVYGSCLSDQNAGVLLCLIDANCDSILQRIPVILKSNSLEPTAMVECDALHFQRGSLDEFTFEGPKLGRIEALWVGIESGQWRLGSVSLTVISACQPSLEGNDGEKIQFTAFQYEFEADDFLLGEGSDTSMVELRPSLVSELSEVEPFNLLSKSSLISTSGSGGIISNEESMREYADLKLSLLAYDAALVFVGSLIANVSAGENEAFAFFIGGIVGFLYLLLLQKSVDGLQASPPISVKTSRIDQVFRGLKGPVSGLALAIGFTSLAVKYSFDDLHMVLTPQELLVGMMGFVACKVAVVLAAIKPVSMGLKEDE